MIWRQGVKRNTHWRFWRSLWIITRANPGVFEQLLVVLAHVEHFQKYRGIVTRAIQEQLDALPPDFPHHSAPIQPRAATNRCEPPGPLSFSGRAWEAAQPLQESGRGRQAASATANMNPTFTDGGSSQGEDF